MELARIAELLQPFLTAPLGELQLGCISTYIDILLRWNARMNLTAIRHPEQIVTRHFGESLFAARHLFPSTGVDGAAGPPNGSSVIHLVDLGSGAGFPGLPIKIWKPDVRATLIESNQRKAVFLREVVRTLTLTDVNVFSGRAEDFPPAQADVVTLRAVERFDDALSLAIRLLKTGGRIALLISEAQLNRAQRLASSIRWAAPVRVPLSVERLFFSGSN